MLRNQDRPYVHGGGTIEQFHPCMAETIQLPVIWHTPHDQAKRGELGTLELHCDGFRPQTTRIRNVDQPRSPVLTSAALHAYGMSGVC
jgi:hypothetical protein